MTTSNPKTFVLGVGTQKGGTTWLFHYLAQQPHANFGFEKEYHIWDAVHSDLCKDALVRLSWSQKLRSALTPYATTQALVGGTLSRYRMQHVDGYYENYFRRILSTSCTMTGDITPSYCLLDAAQLTLLREKILKTGAQIRLVFLMRDPLERCWSAVRMYRRLKHHADSDEAHLAQVYATAQFSGRTRYETICENIKAVFKPDEIYFGLYETAFERTEVERLSDFLGIPANFSFVKKQMNQSPKSQLISDALSSEVINHYRQTYDYCSKHFPETKGIWHQPS